MNHEDIGIGKTNKTNETSGKQLHMIRWDLVRELLSDRIKKLMETRSLAEIQQIPHSKKKLTKNYPNL